MKTLLIKPDHLGDFALLLPSLYEAVQLWGKSSFIILASPAQKEWEEILNWMPRIMTWDHPKYRRGTPSDFTTTFKTLVHHALHLRAERWDYGLELTSSRHDLLGKMILFLTGCKARLGQKGHWDFLLTESQDQGEGHQIERMAQRFPKQWNLLGKSDPKIFFPKNLRWINNPNSKILFFPWAGTSAKQWSSERWRELFEHFPESLILTPTPLKGEAEKWEKTLGIPHDSFVFTSSIRETLSAICHSKIIVTLDTGVAHYAWLTGTPLIQLFAATTDARRWQSPQARELFHRPPTCAPCKSEKCLQSEHLCMNAITVEEVSRSLLRISKELT